MYSELHRNTKNEKHKLNINTTVCILINILALTDETSG